MDTYIPEVGVWTREEREAADANGVIPSMATETILETFAALLAALKYNHDNRHDTDDCETCALIAEVEK